MEYSKKKYQKEFNLDKDKILERPENKHKSALKINRNYNLNKNKITNIPKEFEENELQIPRKSKKKFEISVNMNNLGSVKIDNSKTQIIPKNKKRDQIPEPYPKDSFPKDNIDNNLDDENYNKYKNNKFIYNEKKFDTPSDINKGKNSFENKINDFPNLSNNEFYGFINTGNNCYLNSSLQLLTRIDDIKLNLLQNNLNINYQSLTGGNLINTFKKILSDINNNKTPIDPKFLKKEMSKIDSRYRGTSQEDANEFISNFLDGLLEETASRFENNTIINENLLDKIDINPYQNFCNKFYKKRGNSFLLDLIYGVIRTSKRCQNCNVEIIKFNPFNMLELPIYEIAQQKDKQSYGYGYGYGYGYKSKSISLDEILRNYFDKVNNGARCPNCKGRTIITENKILKMPKYLIIFFGRTVGDEYVDNNIDYNLSLNMFNYIYDFQIEKRFNFKLECVIEHIGGAHYGHYTSLCHINSLNDWYRFDDSSYCQSCSGFKSKNAIILLYKSNI